MNQTLTGLRGRLSHLSTLAIMLVIAFWTVPGETFDPILAARELPAEVLNSCAQAADGGIGGCAGQDVVRSRWIGRTARGDLFLVLRIGCPDRGKCRAWFIERTDRGTATLLGVNGDIRLYKGSGVYPIVQLRDEVSDTHSSYTRFEWRGDRYVRTENRVVYRIDGVECGTQEQCIWAAREALRRNDADSAVKIYENIRDESWI